VAAADPVGAAAGLATRFRTLVGADAPLPKPRSPRVEQLRRSWLGAFWHARIAVRAGMPLDDFLRSRLARYVSTLPVSSGRLPVAITVEDGRIGVQPAPARAPDPAGAHGDDWLAPLVAAEGPSVREEATQLELRLTMVDGEIEVARRRADEVAQRFEADVAAGLVAAPATVEATAEQMGRPPIRSAALRNALLAFAAAAIAAETWQIAVPLLAGVGVYPSDLAADAARRPGEVAAVAVFALGVAASLFALAHSGLGAAMSIAAGEPDPARRRWLGAAAGGAAMLATIVALAVAALPRPAAPGAAPGASLALLLLAVPVATTLALRLAHREDAARDQEIAAALAWDRDRALALSERARRLEELEWAEDEQVALERQRDAARRRLRELNLRAVAAARLAAEAAERERAALGRVAQQLVGALELDRYEFVRQAVARGAAELGAPRRRKVPEPPRPVFDATATAQAPAEVETGRLAS
jgi:hypothetical protein